MGTPEGWEECTSGGAICAGVSEQKMGVASKYSFVKKVNYTGVLTVNIIHCRRMRHVIHILHFGVIRAKGHWIKDRELRARGFGRSE
jgi:hypothetical protein